MRMEDEDRNRILAIYSLRSCRDWPREIERFAPTRVPRLAHAPPAYLPGGIHTGSNAVPSETSAASTRDIKSCDGPSSC